MKDGLLTVALMLILAGAAFGITIGGLRVDDATYLIWRFPFVLTLGALIGSGLGCALIWLGRYRRTG